MTTTRQAGPRWGQLTALTAAVLALHALVLRASPGGISLRDPTAATAFMTRTIASPPAPAPQPVAEPPPAPRPAPPPPTVADAPAPAPKPKPPPAPAPPAQAATNSVAQQAALSLPTGAPAEAPIALNPGFTIGPFIPPTPPAAADTPTFTTGAAPAADPARDRLAQPTAFTVPGSIRMRYQVAILYKGMSFTGKGDLLWRQDGSTYEARLELVPPLGARRIQQSTGQITPQGLAPTRFSDTARSEEAAHFERDKGKVTFSSNRPEAALLAGAQDRLSVMLQLGAMVAGDPARYQKASTISVQTASAREADVWLFTVDGEEELTLPGSRMKALKLTRNPRKEFDQTVELWLAPAMDYVPVRVRLTQPNGERYDLMWTGTDKP